MQYRECLRIKVKQSILSKRERGNAKMKNFKKLVSAITAFAMTATMFAGLGISAEAADSIATVVPVEATYINAKNADTNYSDAGTILANQSKISGGVFTDMLSAYNGSDVALVKFDTSEYAGRIKGATLKMTSTCQDSGKNSTVDIAKTGTNWSADTITWGLQSDDAVGVKTVTYLGSVGNANSSGTALSYDLTDDVAKDADGIVSYGFYTQTGRQQALTNMQLELTVAETAVEYTTVTVRNVLADGTVIAEYAFNDVIVGDPFTVTGEALLSKEYEGSFYLMNSKAVTTIDAVTQDAVLDILFEKASGAVILSENFDSLSDTWGFTTSSGVSLVTEGTNKYLQFCTANGSLAEDSKTMGTEVSDENVVDISFRWKTTVDLNAGGGRASYLALRDANDKVFFAMSGASNRPNTAWMQQVSYGFDGNYGAYTKIDNGDNNFYTINLQADFIGQKLSGTITNSAGTEVANFADVAIDAESFAKMTATNLGSLAPMAIDDFTVMEGATQTVTYTVTNSTDNSPVVGAIVTVLGQTATTNENGIATMQLPAGEYTANVVASMYMGNSAAFTVADEMVNVPIAITYVGVTSPDSVVISGGNEYLYKPAAGNTSVSDAYTAVVYDNVGLVMEDENIVWSLPNTSAGATITDGVVTVTDDFEVTDINGADIVVRAAVESDLSVYQEVTLHVRDVAQLAGFNVTGPLSVKDGKTVSYAVANMVDQYGEEFASSNTAVFTTNNENVTFDGTSLTANTGTSTQDSVTVKATLDGVEEELAITVYGYDFYEPGKVVASYGDPRMESVNDVETIVWPASSLNTASTVITLPDPVALENGTAKMITFKNTWTENTVGAQERSLTFKNSSGAAVLSIGYAGASVVTDYVKTDGSFGGTEIGRLGTAGTETEAIFIIKTDTSGKSSAALSYNGKSIEIDSLGENLGDIASITMTGGKGAPDSRLLTLSDIRIADSDVKMIEVGGADNVAKISGKAALSQFRASIFSQSEGETFTWTVTGDSGVTINQDGVLSVEEIVAPETVVTVSYASDLDAAKSDSKQVTIKDYAEVVSFDLVGAGAVDAGSSVEYKVENIVDEYGAVVDMPVSFEIISGGDVAEITTDGVFTGKSSEKTVYTAKATGSAVKMTASYNSDATLNNVSMETLNLTAGQEVDMTAADGSKVFVWNAVSGDGAMVPAVEETVVSGEPATGEVVIRVTVGNPNKEKTEDKTVRVVKFTTTGAVTSDTTSVDVTSIDNYSADTEYRVTVVKNDGTYTITDGVKAVNDVITIDTTDAASYEVAPIYVYSNVGQSGTYELAAGFYDMEVTNGLGSEREDIAVNGNLIVQNIDQNGKGRANGNSTKAVKDVYVIGGETTVEAVGTRTASIIGNISKLVIKKAPSIVDRKTHLYILGDSLVANYYGPYADAGNGLPAPGDAQTGWGQVFDMFVADDMNVTNLAESGNYIAGLLPAFYGALNNAQPGDYILYEGGYNDSSYSNTDDMMAAMEEAYTAAKAKDVEVIFVTPNASTHGTGWYESVRYTSTIIAKSAELGAKCVNLSGLSFAYMNAMGKDYCAKNFNVYINNGASTDSLHSSYLGAVLNASLVAQALADDADLAGIKIDKTVSYDMPDSEGGTLTFAIN